MSKRILQLVSYLIISLSVGIVVAFITSNLESTAEEKKLRQATRREIRNIVSAFKDSVPGTTSDQIIKFLEKFTADVMKDKVIAVDVLEGKKPDKNDATYLFTFSEEGKKIDIYIKNAYVQTEVYDPDTPEFIQGFFATILMFTIFIIYAEKKRQSLAMQQQFETKQAEMKKALEEHEALALLGQMTATLAHELKTPIATISNLVQVLPSRLSDENFTKRFDILVREELNRTQQLIDNLLIYGKEIAITDIHWIGLKAFIKELADTIGLKTVSCPEIEIYAERFYIRLLFENLLRNSLQAGADEISIKGSSPSPEDITVAEIFYEDNGRGFPEGCDLDELTTPFITHRARGAGLGLYLAQKVALAHGGAISLYRLTKGAGVRISMPRESVRLNEQP